jgi:hypothetical protein
MKPKLLIVVAGIVLTLVATNASAIDATAGGVGNVAATLGRDVTDANDIVVKPCDCEPVANPGVFRVNRQGGGVVAIHYEVIEGTTIATTDGTVVGTVSSVLNDQSNNNQIVVVVTVEGGVLGGVTRIGVRRNAFVWTGSAAVINTTIDDLRTSLQGLNVGV